MSIATELEALNTNIKNAYNAIDTKGGTIPQNKNMVNLPTAINSIPEGGLGADNNLADFLSGTSTTLYDNDATSLRNHIFYQSISTYSFMTGLSFPNVTTVGESIIQNQSELLSIYLPKLTTLSGTYNFSNATKLQNIKLPLLSSQIDDNNSGLVGTFRYSSALTKIDIGNNNVTPNSNFKFHHYVFGNCTNLSILIIRYNRVITCDSANNFTNSGISSGSCYIYVPKALESSYKTAGYWNSYSSKIRAIEDYSDDGTVNGDIN